MSVKRLFIALVIVIAAAPLGAQLGYSPTSAAGDDQALVAQINKPIHDAKSQAVEEEVSNKVEPLRIVIDDQNSWTAEELELVNQVLVHTFTALEESGLDGNALFAGHQIRRYAGKYVNGKPGSVAQVNHDDKTITLSDTAFIRLWGFYIYHELGHVVDQQTGRKLSDGFHRLVGSEVTAQDVEWITANGFWLRDHGHHDREEATADAFALWVIDDYAGIKRPIFPGMPLDVDYAGIGTAIDETLGNIALAIPPAATS